MSDHSLKRQYDVYAAAREEYRQKIDEQADRIAQLDGELSDALTDLNTARQDNASCTVHVHNQADRIAQLEAALLSIEQNSLSVCAITIARAALGEDRT